MIEENSGKFFRFKLDWNLGYAFAEVYDFTDIHSFDGVKVFVYNRVDSIDFKSYILTEITASGIALGPISIYRYPNSRGKGAWKYLFKHDSYIIEEPPIYKIGQDNSPLILDWSAGKKWYRSGGDSQKMVDYVRYSQLRSLETNILNSTSSIEKKATMKYLIDNDKDVSTFYDFEDLGNINMFIQLINTYYPLEKCQALIKSSHKLNETIKSLR